MKKALLVISLSMVGVSFSQNCSELFISEYVEGWGNNKALEIYNPTNQPINLSGYFVARYSNGSNSATVQNSVQLSGTVAPHDVFVAVVDLRDPAGTGQTAPIWDSLEARGDGFFSPVYTVSDAFYFNGNDALLLAKGTLPASSTASVTTATGFQIVDIYGKIGENPGPNTGWSTTAPYNNGLGVIISKDHSMIRRPEVLKGVTTPVTSFNGLAEYDTIPAVTYLVDENGDTLESAQGSPILFGNWFSLGEHNCNCNPLAVHSQEQAQMVVYPNPSADGTVYIRNAAAVKDIVVLNALGQTVSRIANNGNEQLTLRLGADRGVYILRITNNAGAVTAERVVVK